MFVPLFNSLLQFSKLHCLATLHASLVAPVGLHIINSAGVKDSAAISQAIITGGAVAGASFALFQAHPLRPTEPLIHFDLALLLIPALLLGTSVGKLAVFKLPCAA